MLYSSVAFPSAAGHPVERGCAGLGYIRRASHPVPRFLESRPCTLAPRSGIPDVQLDGRERQSHHRARAKSRGVHVAALRPIVLESAILLILRACSSVRSDCHPLFGGKLFTDCLLVISKRLRIHSTHRLATPLITPSASP